ncbi:MAG TPA: amidase [Solirubrobacterales bacterium]|nr:amidase [Solirubrobacterales bacterium]
MSTAADELTGLAAQAGALADGEVSSAELVATSLERIEASQPALNAFRCVRADAAVEEAEECDRRIAAGERSPLLGVPIAIKDDTDISGESTAFGCPGTFDAISEDSEVVRRLREAGAVIVGKTTTSEIGQWPFSEGPGFGITRNPWDLDHTPGGSSGGAAAAVAAELVAGAIGSDGAGSVRIPAAWCHLVGIKPQRGRISTWPHPEAFRGLTCLGPLTRTIGDAALLLDSAAGNHDGDLHRPAPPAKSYLDASREIPPRLRIALSTAIPFSGAPARLDPEIRSAVERMGSVLEGLGHTVDEADPAYGLVGASFMPRSMSGIREWVDRVPDPAVLDPRTRHNAMVGKILSGPLLAAARALERPLRARIGRIFDRFDVVLAPTTAKPAFEIGAAEGLGNWETDRLIVGACPYAWPWNVIGWPGVNVPAGLTDEGLPVGVQLLGPANTEALLISLAAELEAEERWQDRRPPA